MNCKSVGVPSPTIRLAVIFSCSLVTSYVRVSLFGGRPGLNFDFARLSSHVPARGSLACAERLMMDMAADKKSEKQRQDGRCGPPPCRVNVVEWWSKGEIARGAAVQAMTTAGAAEATHAKMSSAGLAIFEKKQLAPHSHAARRYSGRS